MPYSVTLPWVPAGYALEGASKAGDRLKVAVREFTSSEDGELFISRLEGFPSDLLNLLPADVRPLPSAVEFMLAVIWPNQRADIYLNEGKISALVRVGRSIQAGEAVSVDDIVDILKLQFEGINVPPEAAVICILSSGWRKGLFFDLSPLGRERPRREYDLWDVLGSYFAYLTNQALFKLDEAKWGVLFQQGWFPFVSLPKRLVGRITQAVRDGGSIDRDVGLVCEAIRAIEPQIRQRWTKAEILSPHLPLLLHALDKFVEGDYISATGLLYPRIEGIMRSVHGAIGSPSGLKSPSLSSAAVSAWADRIHEFSWLLPNKFKTYLERVYFAEFSPGQAAPMSRHSVAHGVASAGDFNQKNACIGVLIVDQLVFLLPAARPPAHRLRVTAR
jgi:hypothetical protein